MQDSIKHIVDSAKLVKPDSTLLMDSLAKSDSIAKADSIKTAIIHIPHGKEGILHPSLTMNEPWVFIILLILFLLLIAGIVQSSGKFSENIRSFISKKESTQFFSISTVNIIQYRIFTTIFSIGVFSLAAYESVIKHSGQFNLKIYAVFCIITIGYFVLKRVLFEIIGNIFFRMKIIRGFNIMYFGLLIMLSIAFFPILIFFTYQNQAWLFPLEMVFILLIVLFYILLIIKLFQIFYTKLLDLLYIFLYLCTLEILPILILLRVYGIII